jgi:hypothetical protein
MIAAEHMGVLRAATGSIPHFSAIGGTPFCHRQSPLPPRRALRVLAHLKR